MKTQLWQWRWQRILLDKARLLLPFLPFSGNQRILFISERDAICQTQIFPFFFHATDLHLDVRELPLAHFISGRHPYLKTSVDAVCLQTWFDLTPTALAELVDTIQAAWPMAKIAYFDWFAPTDLRYAEVLHPRIAAYVKKQILRDFSQYNQPTFGDTNLTDYYSRRCGLDLPSTRFHIPDGFQAKLWLSPHFAFSDHMLPYFLGQFPAQDQRTIDLHARIAVKGTEWYTKMRQEALDKVSAWEDKAAVVCRGRVSRQEYFAELFNAKLCFSPFGYGEVCWRDFEAMFTGSLLLKPDMSHLSCYPEAFIPFKTYVPLAWDLSDFDEKVEYYLHHPEARATIARNAFELMAGYFRQRAFISDVQPLLQNLGVAP